MKIKIVKTKKELLDSYKIRYKVFVIEQLVSLEEEFDLQENNRIVLNIYYNNIAIGTCRIKIDIDYGKIERFCVLKEFRNQDYGTFLLQYAIELINSKKIDVIKLDAQIQALSFYEKNGFVKYGDIFKDANIDHYHMILKRS